MYARMRRTGTLARSLGTVERGKTMTKEQMRRDIDRHIANTKNINSKKVGNKAKAWGELKALAIITEVNKE